MCINLRVSTPGYTLSALRACERLPKLKRKRTVNKKILIIDDDVSLRKLIGVALKSYDYELIFCQNGLEGLEGYKEHQPALIILDLNMPELNFSKKLKALHLNSVPSLSLQPMIPIPR
jgi:CheY-like chemotaxis protein